MFIKKSLRERNWEGKHYKDGLFINLKHSLTLSKEISALCHIVSPCTHSGKRLVVSCALNIQ